MTAHVTARACSREFIVARDRLSQAELLFAQSDAAVKGIRRELAGMATDLHLPETVDALLAIEVELDRFRRSALMLAQPASENIESLSPRRRLWVC